VSSPPSVDANPCAQPLPGEPDARVEGRPITTWSVAGKNEAAATSAAPRLGAHAPAGLRPWTVSRRLNESCVLGTRARARRLRAANEHGEPQPSRGTPRAASATTGCTDSLNAFQKAAIVAAIKAHAQAECSTTIAPRASRSISLRLPRPNVTLTIVAAHRRAQWAARPSRGRRSGLEGSTISMGARWWTSPWGRPRNGRLPHKRHRANVLGVTQSKPGRPGTYSANAVGGRILRKKEMGSSANLAAAEVGRTWCPPGDSRGLLRRWAGAPSLPGIVGARVAKAYASFDSDRGPPAPVAAWVMQREE